MFIVGLRDHVPETYPNQIRCQFLRPVGPVYLILDNSLNMRMQQFKLYLKSGAWILFDRLQTGIGLVTYLADKNA